MHRWPFAVEDIAVTVTLWNGRQILASFTILILA